MHRRTGRVAADTALKHTPGNMLSRMAKWLQTPQSNNLERHVPAIKVRILWETTFDTHIETASIRALGLYYFSIKAAMSGRATQLRAETSCLRTPKPSRGFPAANSSYGQPGCVLSHRQGPGRALAEAAPILEDQHFCLLSI